MSQGARPRQPIFDSDKDRLRFDPQPTETKMAIWKRLTGVDGGAVDVNLDQVAYLRRTGNVSTIYFVGGGTDQGQSLTVSVKETPDDILKPGNSSSRPMGFGG